MCIFAGMNQNKISPAGKFRATEESRREYVGLSGGRMLFIDEMVLENGQLPALPEGMFVMALYLGDASQVRVDGKTYALRRNELIVCEHRLIERADSVPNMRFRCICLSRECLKELFLLAAGSWDVKFYLDNHPVLRLSEAEADLFCRYFDLFRARLRCPRTRYREELCEVLLHALTYDFYGFLEEFMKKEPEPYSSVDLLFRHFLQLLHESYPKPRLIAPYAERLCVTGKYLSAVCKRVCGKTASELIDDYVIRDVRYLLGRRDKSIKEIANELQFPNVSFFGKYVKQHLGVSPRSFRRQLTEQSGRSGA